MLLIIIAYSILYYTAKYFEYSFYAFIGAGFIPMFKTVANIYYNYSLMIKSKDFDSYKIKKLNEISR